MRPLQKEGTIANYFMNNNGGLIASGQFLISNRPSGWPKALVFNDYKDWGPRLGFAWTPRDTTVVRGGYGLYYSPEITNSYTNMGLNAPFNQFVDVVASASSSHRIWKSRSRRPAVHRGRSARSLRRKSASP